MEPTATTAEPPALAKPLTFYLAACQYPAGILERSRLPNSGDMTLPSNVPGPGDRALQRLGEEQKLDMAPELAASSVGDPPRPAQACALLITGDLIYADATAGLFDPSKLECPWDKAWDARTNNRWFRLLDNAGERIDMLDDHELADNWEPSLNKARNAALRETMYRGRSSFIQRSTRGGHSYPDAAPDQRRLWYASELNGHYLFVGDTRTERQARDPAKLMNARIMKWSQMQHLKSDLLAQRDAAPEACKLIATASMLLPRPLGLADPHSWQAALRCDSWCGYPASLHELLGHIAHHGIQHCVFLSGDEHLPSVTKIALQCLDAPARPLVTLTSIHAGALYAPYPFANARASGFLEKDCFDFTTKVDGHHAHFRCFVECTFPAVRHEGYVKVQLAPGLRSSTVTFRDALSPARDVTYAI